MRTIPPRAAPSPRRCASSAGSRKPSGRCNPPPACSNEPAAAAMSAALSRFLRDHTIGRLNVGLISQLSRQRFEVTVLKVMEESDAIVDRLRRSADRFVIVPTALRQARATILEQSLDVLIYTDLGMDPVT